MADPNREPELRPGPAASGVASLAIVATFCVFQYWLLTSTTEAFNAGNTRIALPAFLASLACFILAAGLVLTGEHAHRKLGSEKDVE